MPVILIPSVTSMNDQADKLLGSLGRDAGAIRTSSDSGSYPARSDSGKGERQKRRESENFEG